MRRAVGARKRSPQAVHWGYADSYAEKPNGTAVGLFPTSLAHIPGTLTIKEEPQGPLLRRTPAKSQKALGEGVAAKRSRERSSASTNGSGRIADPGIFQLRRPAPVKSGLAIDVGTVVAQALGFVRTALLIAAVGGAAGTASAAFQVANALPNAVFSLLAAGVLDAILVPQIVRAVKAKTGGGHLNRLVTLTGTVLFLATALPLVCGPLLVTFLASDMGLELRQLSAAFALICAPQIFFYGIYSMFGGILNAQGIDAPYRWAPVINHVISIVGLGAFLLLLGPVRGVFLGGGFTAPHFWVLSVTATVGMIAQAVILAVSMRKSGVRLRPDFRFWGSSFAAASKIAGWTLATLGVTQIGLVSTVQLATRADGWAATQPDLAGTVAGYTTYTVSFVIFMIPHSLIAVALGTTVFASLVTSAADEDHQAVASQYHMGVDVVAKYSLLATAVIIAGAAPLVQLALISTADSGLARAYVLVLVTLMPGVASAGIIFISQRLFYASRNAAPVFFMGVVPIFIQVGIGWTVFGLADVQWWAVGAALGETCGRVVQGFIAVFLVARANPDVFVYQIFVAFARYWLAAIIALVVGWGILSVIGPLTGEGPLVLRLIIIAGKLILATAPVVAIYFSVVKAVESPQHSPQHLLAQ